MPPLSSRDQLLQRVIVRALTSPLSLYLGGTGLLLLAHPLSWPAGLAVLAVEGAWVWSRIRDPSTARACTEEIARARWRELMTRLEDLTAVLDRETAAALSNIVESQERLIAFYGGNNSSAVTLPHSRIDLTLLLQHCLSLAEKRHRLQTYIASFQTQEVQRQANQLQLRLEGSHDAVTRQLYERALEQKQEELENYVRLGEAIGRIDGQLAAVQCTFDNMLSKVACMQSGHPAEDDLASDPVFAELNQLARGVAALEASLNETLTVRGAA